ncbi:hypothetical protein V5799_016663 [Amblyomma americanum]|uniref:Uncharacterized protein n=1 Tax=Amblyomma americanum TaxID=6943 RepID=A0AAQ4F4H8_AMBAM
MHPASTVVEVRPELTSVDAAYRPAGFSVGMPVQAGELFGHPVSVLLDIGTNSIVVRSDLVLEEALTGNRSNLLLADGSILEVPDAEVLISSPYFSGKSIARCLTTPLYDVFIGNVPGAKERFSINRTVPPRHLTVPDGTEEIEGSAILGTAKEYLGKHYSIEFTIAPTYCNARIKYNSDVCKPIINRPIGLCNAVVHDKPWENWRNVTYFACIPPEDKAKVFEGLLENLSPA